MMKGKKRRGRRGKSRPERKNIKEKETRRWKERRKKEKEKQVDGLCYSVFVTESLHCEGTVGFYQYPCTLRWQDLCHHMVNVGQSGKVLTPKVLSKI